MPAAAALSLGTGPGGVLVYGSGATGLVGSGRVGFIGDDGTVCRVYTRMSLKPHARQIMHLGGSGLGLLAIPYSRVVSTAARRPYTHYDTAVISFIFISEMAFALLNNVSEFACCTL